MGLALSAPLLISFLLALCRATALLMSAPPFSDSKVIPRSALMAVAAGLALLGVPQIPPASLPSTAPGFIGQVLLQVMIGAAMGLVVNLLLSTFVSAGSLIDLAGGLNLPNAIDPLSLEQTPMIGQFYQQVAVLLLFVSGGYVLVIAGFVHSFSLTAPSLASTPVFAEVMVADLATLFSSALEMAGPVLVVLFGSQIVLALLSKAAPQVNVWLLGLPLQIFLALGLVAIAVSAAPAYLSRVVLHITNDFSALFVHP